MNDRRIVAKIGNTLMNNNLGKNKKDEPADKNKKNSNYPLTDSPAMDESISIVNE